MLSPTHVNVVVHRAENLLIKGKNGTNNSFVVIELGKDTYRTSIKEKSGESVLWNEECELKIPKIGNTAAIKLTAYHRNSLGLDQFLGTVKIPLVSFEKFQKSVNWYRLQEKPGKVKGKDKQRGGLEVQVAFITKLQTQSLTSLQSKGKRSFQQLTGSLFNLGNSEKKTGVGKFANGLGKKVLNKKKKDVEIKENIEETCNTPNNVSSIKKFNNLDPGVISDEEDSDSHKSSESLGNLGSSRNAGSLSITPPPKPRRIFRKNPEISVSQWEDANILNSSSLNVSRDSLRSNEKPKLEELRGRLSDRRLSISCVDFSHLITPKPQKKFSSTLQLEKSQGESQNTLSKLARKLKTFHEKKEVKKTDDCSDTVNAVEEETTVLKSEFKNKNKDELIKMVVDLQKRVNSISVRVKDLEDYLDGILLKVMETVPKILEKS